MKIGILTFHRSINYGAYTQCLALSHEIQRRLPDALVEVVDYNSEIMEKNYKVKLKLNRHTLGHPLEVPQKIARKKAFRRALKYLPLSPEQIIDDGCERVFEYIKSRYDLVVTGSDAVWNWIKRGFPNPYLLGFEDGPRRVSCAASAFGMGMKYLTDEKRAAFGKWLAGYEYIGVRDGYTANLVKECFPGAEVNFNCDPTAYLDLEYVYSLLGETKESFRRRIYKRCGIPEDKRLICVMGTDRALIKKIRQRYRATHRVIAVFSATGAEDAFLYDLDPLEWSLVFGLCDLTLTNFFHGTLLSIRNSTPVISIDHSDFGTQYKGKLEDALESIGFKDCFFRRREAIADGWEKVVAKADELIADRAVRGVIDANRKKLVLTAESFFSAIGAPGGVKDDVAPKTDRRYTVEFVPGSGCAGCGVCAAKCPTGAISFIRKNGFDYPAIDRSKCTRCGMCSLICPVNAEKESRVPSRVVAIADKDREKRLASSSGGAVGLIARGFFERGGVVSGVVYDEKMRPVHRIIRSEEELARVRGSKYVQAKTGGIFAELAAELEAGRPVLATGTPCQIAAVKAYFGSRYDDLLYTLDLVCHGVQSPAVFEGYIKKLEEKNGSRVVDLKFRDKAHGWHKSNVRVIFENGKELVLTRAECEYFKYFDYLRTSCYNCVFRQFRGSSDLTAGDYWGIETLTDVFNDDRGVSLLICNTEKGERLLESAAKDAEIVESDLAHALATHKKLKSSVSLPPPRDKFFLILGDRGFKKAARWNKMRTLPYNFKVKIRKAFK